MYRGLLILFMTIIVQTSVATDEVKELFLQKYYLETVRLIFDDSEAIHNVDGTKDGEIADRVFYILYKVDDNVISKEQKLDLLHQMLFFHNHATRAYRYSYILARVDHKWELYDKILEHPEYSIPLMNAPTVKLFDFIDLLSFENNMGKYIPSSYFSYYQQHLRIIEMKKFENNLSQKEDYYMLMKRIVKERKLNVLDGREIDLEKYSFNLH